MAYRAADNPDRIRALAGVLLVHAALGAAFLRARRRLRRGTIFREDLDVDMRRAAAAPSAAQPDTRKGQGRKARRQ